MEKWRILPFAQLHSNVEMPKKNWGEKYDDPCERLRIVPFLGELKYNMGVTQYQNLLLLRINNLLNGELSFRHNRSIRLALP